MASKDIFKEGQPDWLKFPKEKTNDSVFKEGMPDWLRFTEPEPNDSVFKEGMPDWLDFKIHGKTSGLPDWLETNSDGKIIDNSRKQDYWNLAYLTTSEEKYCEDRGIYRFLKGKGQATVKAVLSQWKYMERRTGQVITLGDVKTSNIPHIREKAELEEINELKDYISKSNSIIEPDLEIELDFEFPSRTEFDFNTDAESQHYLCTHTVFDVETSKQSQQPIAVGAYNYEANRLVIAVNSKLAPEKAGEFYLINDNTYLIYTPNLWEGVLIADIEMVLSTIYESALMEGHNDLTKIFIDLKLPKKLKIDEDLLESYINGFPKRRSLWLAHNARFDIDMINHTHKEAKYQFTFLQKQLEHETLKYFLGSEIPKEKIKKDKEIAKRAYNVPAYKIHLGNTDAGFKFRVNLDNAGMKTIFRANLSPKQKKTFTQMWICDTFQLSLALQNPHHSLKDLSAHHPVYKKMEYDELNFPVEHMDIISHKKITKPVKYLIFDLFATLTAYEAETKDLDYNELQTLIQEKTPDFELKTAWRPRVSSILSTASISKQFIFPYLEAKTGINRKAIENNISHERLHQANFQEVYSGGVTEAIVYGILESIFPKGERVFYDDYESLYPNVARLVFAELLYVLAASRKLHTYLTTDLDSAKKDFWNIAERTIAIIRQSLKGRDVELPEDIFKDLIGTVQIKTDHPIQIRTKSAEGKRCWKKVKGVVNLHLIDLLNSVVRGAIEFNTDIHVLMSSIKFVNVERYDFKHLKVPEFGDELFTLLLGLRRIKKSEKNPIEKMLKYIVNTAYGITAEGINNEDITGKLFIPAIFSSITAGARFLISIPEIVIPKLGGVMGYSDTDSIIYRIQEKLRSRVLQLSRKLSILKEETDYGRIHKAFLAKKKKYYVLTENIAEHKFKKQFIKLDDGMYIVGKIHGIASFDKELYVKAVFPIINELFTTFTIEKPNITRTVKKYIHLHPRFSNLTYKKKTHSKIKGLIHFFQKTRRITAINNATKEKTKVRIPNPVITLFKTKYDIFDIYFYYDLSNDKILITNLKEKPIRSNFGIYANLGNNRVKIFYTIPIDEDSQLDWENKFLKMIIDSFWNNFEQFWQRIAKKQREFILDFAKNTRALLEDEYLAEMDIKPENFNTIFDNWFSEFRCPIPKNKRFFDLDYKLYDYKDIKFNKKTVDWYGFTQEFGEILLSQFESNSQTDIRSMIEEIIQSNETSQIRLLNQLLASVGLNKIQLPTIRWLRAKASEISLIDRSKMKKEELWNYLKSHWYRESNPSESFEYLIERINEMIDYSPDGRIEWIIDQLMDTRTVEYSNFLSAKRERLQTNKGMTKKELLAMPESWRVEVLGITNLDDYEEPEVQPDSYSLEDVPEEEKINIVGYQYYERFMNETVGKFVKEAIDKADLEDKLIQQLSFKADHFNRYVKDKNERYLTTGVITQKQDVEGDEMLTHEVLGESFFTDGIDWRLTAYLPELDFAGELVANQNSFYSQNLINLGRVGTYIYYTTHKRADQIPNIWNTNPTELPCPKSAKYIQIPLRMRYLPDPDEDVYSRNQIKLAFASDELDELVQDGVLEPTNKKNDHYRNKDKQLLNAFIHKKIISKSYMIVGRKKPEGYQEQFPIYVERKFMNDAYSFEICSNRSWEYNSKLYIEFLVQPNKNEQKRFLNVDLHINPNSHNLMNIELFKANIKDIEANDWIVRELLLGLFTIHELSFFSRNASLTVSDVEKKEELSYLRKTQYLFITHTLLQEAIEIDSTCKIGKLALTGQLKLQNTNPETLFAYLNNMIIQKHDNWLESLDPSRSLSVASKEISTLPHRSSHGITINHWKNGIHISLYTKDKHWYKSKITRVARARNFEITPTLSKKIMNKVWDEKATVRYEITLMGFEAIHTKEYHAVLRQLEQFFFQLDAYFGANPEATEVYQKHAKKIRKAIPNPLFQISYNTPDEELIELTGVWIKTYKDDSGYSHRVKTYDEIHNIKKPPDPPPLIMN